MDLAAPEQEGVDLIGKVGSAQAAPPALGPPSPGRAAEVFSSLTPSTVDRELSGWQCATSISPSGVRGAVAPRPPHKPAREATLREEETAFASRESIQRYIPMPHPRTCSPLSAPFENRGPRPILYTLAVSPGPTIAALPRPAKAHR